jgi:hypothetical protein
MSAVKQSLVALGIVALMLGGCASTDFFGLAFQQGNTPGGDRVLVGSVEHVAESTKATLSRFGMAAVETRDGQAVHIASATPSGAKFKLILTREKGKEGEHTRVHVEWEGRSDGEAVFALLAQLDARR